MGGALGAVMGYASILDEDDELNPEQQARCVRGIAEGAETLAALIDELRAYAGDRPPIG